MYLQVSSFNSSNVRFLASSKFLSNNGFKLSSSSSKFDFIFLVINYIFIRMRCSGFIFEDKFNLWALPITAFLETPPII